MSSKPSPGSVGQNLTLANLSAHRSFVSRDAIIDGAYMAVIVKQTTTTILNLLLLGAIWQPLVTGKELVGNASESRESLNSEVPHPTQ